METTNQFDSLKAEQFAGTLVDTFNKAALNMMISLGHRTGLFDSLAGKGSINSKQLAGNAFLHERYVREWLGAMVTGGIVEYQAEDKTYKLPDEHAAFLTRQAGADNFALLAQYIPAVAKNEDDLLRCFKNGGGISYEKYLGFYHAMNEDKSAINTFMNHLIPAVNDLAENLKKGITVLDAGCGAGSLANHLALQFPKSNFIGLDLSEYAIDLAKKEALEKRLSNVKYEIQDLTDFDQTATDKTYDLVMTIDAIHDQHKPKNVLKGIYRSLKETGVYIMVDVNGTGHVHKDSENPFAPFIYSISCMHCVPVSISQGGEGLGAMWGEQKIREYLKRNGIFFY